jgi:hypothetical protein
MAYSQGGVIAAADYNTLIGSSPSSTANTINTVWAVGNGSAGYGQTALAQVSQSGTVTATQWASLINTLNSILTHQAGSGSGISAPTAGTTINYLSTLQSSINTAYSNKLNAASVGSTSTAQGATTTAWSSATTSGTVSGTWGTRVAFASADAARYFFNAGGKLKFNFSAAANASTTARTNEIVALAGFLGGVTAFAQGSNGGRTGTGGTLGTNNTTKGYWTTTKATNTNLVVVTSTTANYTSDTGVIYVNLNGTAGSNGDNGYNIDFYGTLNSTSGANGTGGAYSFDDSFSVNVTRSVDITYPESTNLTNSWGTPTFTAL